MCLFIRISLTKALVLWWCDNKSDLINHFFLHILVSSGPQSVHTDIDHIKTIMWSAKQTMLYLSNITKKEHWGSRKHRHWSNQGKLWSWIWFKLVLTKWWLKAMLQRSLAFVDHRLSDRRVQLSFRKYNLLYSHYPSTPFRKDCTHFCGQPVDTPFW